MKVMFKDMKTELIAALEEAIPLQHPKIFMTLHRLVAGEQSRGPP